MQIAVGGCLAQKDRGEIVRRAPWVDVVFGTHNIGSLPVLLERARHNRRGRGRDPRVARGVPLHPAHPARVRLRRLGLDQRRLQQHLHVLHRPQPARQGEGPPPGRDPRRGRGARRRGRRRGDAAGPERQHLRRRVRRPARLRQAAARVRRRRGPRAGPVHQPAPAAFTDDVIDAMAETPNVMPQLHMPLQSGSDRVLRRCAGPTAASGSSASSTGSAPRCPTPRSPPTSSSASPARPRRTSRPPSTSSPPRFAAPSPSSTPPPRHARRHDARPGAQGRRAGAVRAARRPAGGDLLGENRRRSGPMSRCSSPRGRAARTPRPPAVRPGPRQPARPLRAWQARQERPGDVTAATGPVAVGLGIPRVGAPAG
jgi:tRNA-2-methylthio-N6-dimethylallyladenosine synthase